MSQAAARTRRRHRLVTAVLDDLDRHGLSALADWEDAIAREYGDDDPDTGLGRFLVDVECRWQRIFDARLDDVLENDAADLQAAVHRLWKTMAAELAGSRLLLDAHAGHPALARTQTRHRRMLAAVTGVRVADLQTHQAEQPTSEGATHGREHRAEHTGRLRVRPLCPWLHRRSVPAA